MFKCAFVVCGFLAVAAAASSGGRIAGGIDAREGQFPYQVSLRDQRQNHFCGGAILNARWIITAASCAQGKVAADIMAMVGSKSLSRGGSYHQVDRVVVHPNFAEEQLLNDVAVMRVRSPIVMNPDTMAVMMANYHTSIAYGALVSGWGRRGIDQPQFPDWLQYVPTTIITNTECEARFESPYNGRITDAVLCSASPEGQGICLGDAGGPLVHSGQLQGIVSWGIPCGMGYPDVYARVSVHRAWALVHTMI